MAHPSPGTAPSSLKEEQDQDQDREKGHEKVLLELEKLKPEPEKQQQQKQQQQAQARLHHAQDSESLLTRKHPLVLAPPTTQGLPAAAAPVEFNLPSPAATAPIESATTSIASGPSTPAPTVASTTVITSYPTAHDRRRNSCTTVATSTTTTTSSSSSNATNTTDANTANKTPSEDPVQPPGTADFVSATEAAHPPEVHSQKYLSSSRTGGISTAPSPALEASVNGDFASSYSRAPMSNAPPPHGHARQHQHQQQHVGYPGQPAYSPPPPPMNPGGPYGYPSVTTQAPDPYRTPQPLPPNPALALPSMRSLDPLQHQHQQAQHQQHPQHPQHPQHQQHPQHPHQHPHPHPHPHQHHAQAMAMTPQMAAYYQPPAHMAMHPYGLHPGSMAFPMGDPRLSLSGGRHKKDIKRRTKTGCLTCRKRRIKCDETHPTCNNCKKSKRDCAGYDPIFKQTPPGPSAIQPAPNHGGGAPTVPPPAQPLQQPQSEQQQHHHPQDQQQQQQPPSLPGGGPSTSTTNSPGSSPYGHQPAVVPSSYPPVQGHQYDTAGSTLTSTVDYSGGAIDPALDTGSTGLAGQHASSNAPYRAGSPAFYFSGTPSRLS